MTSEPENRPLLTFTGRMRGRDAEFAIYPDRLEWSGGGRLSKGKAITGLATGGTSLLVTGINRKHQGDQTLPVASISRVAAEGNIVPKVEVTTSGRPLTIRVKDAGLAKRVASVLSQLISSTHQAQNVSSAIPPAPPLADPPLPPPPPPSSNVPPAPSVASELRQLAELRKEGVLTEEEFRAQKAQILKG